jgi:GDPmannose 4,6-dehydratase
MKRAIITGITGQDGSYLAQHLLSEGYDVFGFVHGEANPHIARVKRLLPDVQLIHGDLLDLNSVLSAVEQAEPDEFYNLAAMTYVPESWQQAEMNAEVTGLGVLRALEAVRLYSGETGDSPRSLRQQVRFYQASSAEMFGRPTEVPQNEQTPFHPVSPYGVAKLYGHYLIQSYREQYGMFAVSGIMFNHESPRRRAEFLSRKVSLGAAKIKFGHERQLRLGSLSGRRDWGFAGDYVRAMHLMLTQERPDDYVIGTGVTHTVEEFVEIAFRLVGLDWRRHVVYDTSFIRPIDADHLCADPAKAKKELGWTPTVGFEQLVEIMVDSDVQLLSATRDQDL